MRLAALLDEGEPKKTAPYAEELTDLLKRYLVVGGVGDLTAISILSGLPEIGTLSDEKLNRLVGSRNKNGNDIPT